MKKNKFIALVFALLATLVPSMQAKNVLDELPNILPKAQPFLHGVSALEYLVEYTALHNMKSESPARLRTISALTGALLAKDTVLDTATLNIPFLIHDRMLLKREIRKLIHAKKIAAKNQDGQTDLSKRKKLMYALAALALLENASIYVGCKSIKGIDSLTGKSLQTAIIKLVASSVAFVAARIGLRAVKHMRLNAELEDYQDYGDDSSGDSGHTQIDALNDAHVEEEDGEAVDELDDILG